MATIVFDTFNGSGLVPTGEIRLQRGYISRKTIPGSEPVYEAGGSRRGEMYYLAPNFKSTRYCYRVYVRKGEQS